MKSLFVIMFRFSCTAFLLFVGYSCTLTAEKDSIYTPETQNLL